MEIKGYDVNDWKQRKKKNDIHYSYKGSKKIKMLFKIQVHLC